MLLVDCVNSVGRAASAPLLRALISLKVAPPPLLRALLWPRSSIEAEVAVGPLPSSSTPYSGAVGADGVSLAVTGNGL